MYFKTPLTRTYATTATLQRLIGRPLLGRYRILPTDIFRIQTGRSTALRDYDHQMRLGKRLYDLHVRSDGLVHPVTGDFFEGIFLGIFFWMNPQDTSLEPNGCLCRANGFVLKTLVRKFGSVGSTVVFRLPAGAADFSIYRSWCLQA